MNKPLGKAILVGAGPGDPGLITLRGAQALAEADVVLYDYLASAHLLSGTKPGVELHCLGRHGQGRLWKQQDICDRMVAEARLGKTVVRLKGGDPAVFGRLADELTALDKAGISYEVVPGISAATAAGSYAGIPLTQRDVASSVTFVTGQETPDKSDASGLDYRALAGTPGTLVFYMGVTTAPTWSQALLDHGKSPATPLAIIRRCSLPDQQVFIGTLQDAADMFTANSIRPPAIAIVGEVAHQKHTHDWFTARPLYGQTVLITRPRHQAADMIQQFARLGAEVMCQAAIEIGPPADWQPVDDTIARLDSFDWIVFSSRNGVQSFLGRLADNGLDVRALAGVQIAAIGPATVDALREFSLHADACPDTYRAEALAERLAPQAAGRRLLLVRASRGRETLAEMLTAAGGQVEQVVAYSSCDVTSLGADVAEAVANRSIGWITVTSSAIARSLVNLLGDDLAGVKLAAISPLTAEVLAELGFPPAVVAQQYTSAGVVGAICNAGESA